VFDPILLMHGVLNGVYVFNFSVLEGLPVYSQWLRSHQYVRLCFSVFCFC